MHESRLIQNVGKKREKAILAGIVRQDAPKKYSEPLEELENLASTAGVEILARFSQVRTEAHLSTYFGSGKVKELEAAAAELGADLVIVNDDLPPAQARNLEKELKVRVIDRTELILHIFASHAKTREAKLQVELAQLEYALPRLRRLWEHLDRYEGGIGTRGPGEKQLESDKRLVKKRIQTLTAEIRNIQNRKEREVLERNTKFITVGLVGYTNAGKSSLMNRLTNADVLVEDKLFATLETCTRLWEITRGRKVLLSDTVGFIDKLPHHLVASFKATLEEASQSDILLHVVDASHPDAVHQIEVVRGVLRAMGLGEKEELLVFNKIDKIEDPVDLGHLAEIYPCHVMVSVKEGKNIEGVCRKILEMIEAHMVDVEVTLSVGNGKLISWLEEYGRVLKKTYLDEQAIYQVRLSKANAKWLSSTDAQTSYLGHET